MPAPAPAVPSLTSHRQPTAHGQPVPTSRSFTMPTHHHRLRELSDRGEGTGAWTCAFALGARRSWASLNVRLLSFSAMREPAHLALHPFGQIPTYGRRRISPCSSRAASCSILPSAMRACCQGDANARARAITWMFAALSTGGAADPRPLDRQASRGRQALGGGAPAFGPGAPPGRLSQLSVCLGDARCSTAGSAPAT